MGPRLRTMSAVATFAFVLLVLTGCEPLDDRPDRRPNGDLQQPSESGPLPEVGKPTAGLVIGAARNAPRVGSVTQGSRGTGTTADTVRWTGDGVILGNLDLTQDVTEILDPKTGFRYYSDSGGNAVSAVTSRIRCRGGAKPTPHFDESDPVVFGPWMYRTTSGFVWGMFADGLAANDSTGTPGTYAGCTIGVYIDAEGVVEFFAARVTLELSGSGLTGSIDRVHDIDGIAVEVPGGGLPTIALEAASAPPGLRRGDTTFKIGGTRQPGADGKWGVTFLAGGAAAGTWGATDGTYFSVVGAFSATTTP